MTRFTVDKIRKNIEALEKHIAEETIPAERIEYRPGVVCIEELNTVQPTLFSGEARWSGDGADGAFSTSFIIPEAWEGKPVTLRIRTGREGGWSTLNPQFAVYLNRNLFQGADTNHHELRLMESARPGERIDVDLIGWMGTNGGEILLSMSLCAVCRPVEGLYYDVKVPYDTCLLFPEGDYTRERILQGLNEAVNQLDYRTGEAIVRTAAEASEWLRSQFYGKDVHPEGIVHAVGHTHIDVAWLWTLAQTRRKTVRSFSTVLELMKRYPEYIFMSSQPQLYEYMKQEAPGRYEEIKARVAEGRWEAEGAMWLEADCNLSSGESLIRQILHGKRFFRREFGVDNRILHLPDVFGYSASIPQILKKTGIDYFLTSKISWNETNNLPYDTFVWEGIDGTEILTHFITTADYPIKNHTTTYVGTMKPSHIKGTWERYQQKMLSSHTVHLYGYGDGGGGTTPEMLETYRRMERGIPGLPQVKISTLRSFFEELKESLEGKPIPRWVGELYLEYHRGTYTSMSRNKRYNRKSEFAFQDAELYSVWDAAAFGGCYPKKQLEEGWRTILLNQFHDIIPGSSIREVYEESREQYEEILSSAASMQRQSLEHIVSNIALPQRSVVVFNPTSFVRNDAVTLPGKWQVWDGENPLTTQITHDGQTVFCAPDIPSKGYKAFSLREAEALSQSPAGDLENERYRIGFDQEFQIVSIFDKAAGRELIREGRHAGFRAYEDMPRAYDNWEISDYYAEKFWDDFTLVSAELLESGPVRKVMRIRRQFFSSTLEQDVILYAGSGRIDFQTRIDWREKDILVKYLFPLDIHTDSAACEIQFGHVKRPTHRNTSWDAARFEVCAHKWVDLSESNYGVSVLNDCKYGFHFDQEEMGITLVKSTCYPNPDADKEYQEFTFSLLPHSEGLWNTIREAYLLNCPAVCVCQDAQRGAAPLSATLLSLKGEGVVVETVKQAEQGEDIIVRLYEATGGRRRVSLKSDVLDLSDMVECDMLEAEEQPVDAENVSFLPFEIKTLRIKR